MISSYPVDARCHVFTWRVYINGHGYDYPDFAPSFEADPNRDP